VTGFEQDPGNQHAALAPCFRGSHEAAHVHGCFPLSS
jgi:hypothetical protein